jgi:hypothetical protein
MVAPKKHLTGVRKRRYAVKRGSIVLGERHGSGIMQRPQQLPASPTRKTTIEDEELSHTVEISHTREPSSIECIPLWDRRAGSVDAWAKEGSQGKAMADWRMVSYSLFWSSRFDEGSNLPVS